MIKFLLVNKEIKVFPGKVKLKERSLLFQDEHIMVFVFLLFVLTVKCILFVEKEKYLCLREDEQFMVHPR